MHASSPARRKRKLFEIPQGHFILSFSLERTGVRSPPDLWNQNIEAGLDNPLDPSIAISWKHGDERLPVTLHPGLG